MVQQIKTGSNSFCKLIISKLMLLVRLGCRAHEKKSDQIISVTIEIQLKEIPEGIKTDQLEDTVCYSKIAKHIQRFVEGKQFNLVEKLSKDLHKCICNFLIGEGRSAMRVKVTIHKTMPKNSAIKGGIFFTYVEDAE